MPSVRSTRRTSRNTSTIFATNASGVGSSPICWSMRWAPHLPQVSRYMARFRDAAATVWLPPFLALFKVEARRLMSVPVLTTSRAMWSHAASPPSHDAVP